MLGSWKAELVAGVGALVGLVVASHLLPPAPIRAEHAVLMFAAWFVAATATAATVRLALHLLPPDALVAGTGWIAGTLLAASMVGSRLCPGPVGFQDVGPSLVLWLGAGSVTISLGQRGEPRGWWSVPARVVVTWAATHGGVWLAVGLLMVSGRSGTPGMVHVSFALGAALVLITLFALVSGWVGASEPGPQLVASWLVQPLVLLTGPGGREQLLLWRAGHVGPLLPMVAAAVSLSILSLAASMSAAAVITHRSGRALRRPRADAALRA